MHALRKAVSQRRFVAVAVKRKVGVESPRSFSDYEVTIDHAAISAGIEVIERM
jgi:CRISPR-associated protein Csd2